MFPDLRSPKGYVGLILMLAMLAAPLALGTPFWTNLFVLLFVFSACRWPGTSWAATPASCRWATPCSTASAATPPRC